MAGKSAAVKKLQGNPGKRKAVQVETPAEEPVMPAPFEADQRYSAVWRELVGRLMHARVLTAGDGIALEMLTVALVNFREMEAEIRENGYHQVTPNGYEALRPCVNMWNLRQKQLQALLQQFGLTPVSRKKAERTADGGKDPLGEFLDS